LPDHEDWHNLLQAIEESRLRKRGVSRNDVLLHIYESILCQWYEQADTQSFICYHKKLADFMDWAKIKSSIRWENAYYRWLYLLSWLSEMVQGNIPAVFLESVTDIPHQFQHSIRIINIMQQLFVYNFSRRRLLAAIVSFWILLSGFIGIPVVQLLEMLPFLSTLPGTWGTLIVISAIIFVSAYRYKVVLSSEGLHYGSSYNYRYLAWEGVYRVRTRFSLLQVTLDGATLWMWPAKQDRAWLEQTMQLLVRRAQGATNRM
jgi:hypothetical protein